MDQSGTQGKIFANLTYNKYDKTVISQLEPILDELKIQISSTSKVSGDYNGTYPEGTSHTGYIQTSNIIVPQSYNKEIESDTTLPSILKSKEPEIDLYEQQIYTWMESLNISKSELLYTVLSQLYITGDIDTLTEIFTKCNLKINDNMLSKYKQSKANRKKCIDELLKLSIVTNYFTGLYGSSELPCTSSSSTGITRQTDTKKPKSNTLRFEININTMDDYLCDPDFKRQLNADERRAFENAYIKGAY